MQFQHSRMAMQKAFLPIVDKSEIQYTAEVSIAVSMDPLFLLLVEISVLQKISSIQITFSLNKVKLKSY